MEEERTISLKWSTTDSFMSMTQASGGTLGAWGSSTTRAGCWSCWCGGRRGNLAGVAPRGLRGSRWRTASRTGRATSPPKSSAVPYRPRNGHIGQRRASWLGCCRRLSIGPAEQEMPHGCLLLSGEVLPVAGSEPFLYRFRRPLHSHALRVPIIAVVVEQVFVDRVSPRRRG